MSNGYGYGYGHGCAAPVGGIAAPFAGIFNGLFGANWWILIVLVLVIVLLPTFFKGGFFGNNWWIIVIIAIIFLWPHFGNKLALPV